VREEDAALEEWVRGAAREPLYARHQRLVDGLAPELLHQLVVVDLAVGAAGDVPGGDHLLALSRGARAVGFVRIMAGLLAVGHRVREQKMCRIGKRYVEMDVCRLNEERV
jgi:hypothetical protein